MINDLLEYFAGVDDWILLVLALLLPFGETVALLDVVVPGEVGMVLLGATARDSGVSLVAIIALGSVGAFLGDSVGWYLGRRWGVGLIDRWGPVRRRLRPALERAESHFADRGGRAVFFGRFVGVMRAIVPLVAGASGMPYRRFAVWNAAASIAWITTIVTAGAYLGPPAADFLDRYGILVTISVALVAVAWLVHRLRARARRRALTTAGADPTAETVSGR